MLHLGHAYSALFARRAAGPQGVMLLRIEDIDQGRCRARFAAAIERDLAWLGLDWPRPTRVQSAHFDLYRGLLDRLAAAELLYPCFCTRAALADFNISAPHGPSPIYPGLCRGRARAEREELIAAGTPYALRLDSGKAAARAGSLIWRDLDKGEIAAQPELLGDAVLARKDIPASYHLAVVADDAAQEIDIVTRGEDLFAATHLHRLLQAVLDLPVPVWRHHRLIVDDAGKRLAKRDGAASLAALREAGVAPADIRRRLGFED
jgi:glutamyl-Q tRNA(Asp) synthetase